MGIAIPRDHRDDWGIDSYAARELAIRICWDLFFGAIRPHRLITTLFSQAPTSRVRKFLAVTMHESIVALTTQST